MKDFVKMTLAVICGLFIMSIIGFILFFGVIGSLAAIGSGTPSIPSSGVLLMDMSGIAVTEQTQESSPLDMVQGNDASSIGIWDAVQAVNAAAEDPAVQYIYLKPEGLSSGIAQLEELRQALLTFRQSGKAVIAYVENPSTGAYYLATAADKIYMGDYSGSSSMLTGVGTQLIFLKDILDKFGVNVQLIRHGKYKSAGEMYIKNAPSPENLEQNQEMINSIWDNLSSAICEAREISKEQLNALIDELVLTDAKAFLDNRLVDELMGKDALKEKLATLAGKESFDKVQMIAFEDYVAAQAAKTPLSYKKSVAIIFADGNIIDGEDKSNVAGDRFVSVIEKVKADSTVKAVVLRVNSPGGSVVASDKIRQALDQLRKVKPVVASYGAYAASGGYWISNGCDRIFSDPSTLTGSIGVFSMIPDFSKTAKDILKVGIMSVTSNKHGDMYSGMRPLDAQEIAFMQNSVNDIYDEFVGIVAEGRGMEPAAVDEIAQGRVWTGSDALRIGLVDEIGSLQDAVHYTAGLLGDPALEEFGVTSYPKPQTMLEMLLETFGASASAFSGTPFESIGNAFKDWNWQTSERIFARMPFEYVIE